MSSTLYNFCRIRKTNNNNLATLLLDILIYTFKENHYDSEGEHRCWAAVNITILIIGYSSTPNTY